MDGNVAVLLGKVSMRGNTAPTAQVAQFVGEYQVLHGSLVQVTGYTYVVPH